MSDLPYKYNVKPLYGYLWQNQSCGNHHWWSDNLWDLIYMLITLPFQSKLTNYVSRAMTALKPAKKRTVRSEFFFWSSSHFRRHWVALNSLVITTQTLLLKYDACLKNLIASRIFTNMLSTVGQNNGDRPVQFMHVLAILFYKFTVKNMSF